jgi:thiosulfate reductase cytochrome b subunit
LCDIVILGWLYFPDAVVIGKWAQYGLQWDFFGMWIFVLNGLTYLTYGIVTGRFRRENPPLKRGSAAKQLISKVVFLYQWPGLLCSACSFVAGIARLTR